MAATTEQTAALEVLQKAQQEYQQALVDISATIATQKQNIADAQSAVTSDQAQLASATTAAQKESLTANILYNESVVAANTAALNTNEGRLQETQNLLNQNAQEQQSISEAANGPGAAAPSGTASQQDTTATAGPEATSAANVPPEEDPYEAARLAAAEEAGVPPTESAVPVSPDEDPFEARRLELEQEANRQQLVEEDALNSAAETAAQIGKNNSQLQKTLQARLNKPSQNDWRVRIHLAQGSNYLYNAPIGNVGGKQLPGPGILAPLAVTDGVIFPYTPTIETSYQAKYQTADLVHSNYRGYFYQNSFVDTINIRGTFTAQDTSEAQYLLAVIHFFRSVTKMFYGQDANAGTPPPLVFLSGLGQYQYNKHPCVVSNFQYSLPNDVDYIRANGFNNYGVNLENRANKSSGPGGGTLGFLANKLGLNGLFAGGLAKPPTQSAVTASITNATPTDSTYVPTKMEISIALLPIQTRSQVSQQFSLESFANGNLLKGGFW